MSRSQKLLIVGGLLLTLLGTTYGLYYALFDEHQTLEGITVSLARGFSAAAEKRMDDAHTALDTYRDLKFEYVREVDVHSHWSGLAVLLILLGLMFDQLGLSERTRYALAAALVAGAFLFPFGVILQIVKQGLFAKGLAAVGAGVLVVALGIVALGFARQGKQA